jgi:hypothetical protein
MLTKAAPRTLAGPAARPAKIDVRLPPLQGRRRAIGYLMGEAMCH